MEKILFIALLILTGTVVSFAQIDEEDLRIEMEQMEEQMSQAFKMLELTFQDGQLFEDMDTLLFKMIPDIEQPAEVYPNGDPYELHHLLDQLMGAFSEENRIEMEQFFRDFEQRIPNPEEFGELRKPEDLEDESAEPKQKKESTLKKRRKKSKVYQL